MYPKGKEGGPSYKSVFDVIRLALTDKDKKKDGQKQNEQPEDKPDEEDSDW